MQPGKILNYIAPWGVWGTHCFIYKASLWILKGNGVKLKRDFPSFNRIIFNEGLKGPDGAVMRSRLKASSMYYNPTTNKGDVLKAIASYYKKLEQASLNTKQYDESFAKIATWLGHFIVDALSPPHHFGYYENSKVALMFWHFKSNWHDPYSKNIISKHFLFEIRLALAGRKKFFGPVKLKPRLIESIIKDEENLISYIKDKMKRVDELHLYDEYMKNGWSKKIKKKMNRELIPEMASVVATVWYAAINSKRQD